MLKLIAVPIVAAIIALGSSQAQALPTQKVGIMQDAVSGVTLAVHRGSPVWRRYPSYHGQYRSPRYNYNRHYANRYYGNRHYHPYHRRHYRPYLGWNYCGWGFGYWPNGCFGDGYYGGYLGGYYGDSYYDRGYEPRREHVSNKKHIKWCKVSEARGEALESVLSVGGLLAARRCRCDDRVRFGRASTSGR